MHIESDTNFPQQCAIKERTVSPVETIFLGEAKRRILRVTRMLHQSFRSRKLERMPSSILEKSIRARTIPPFLVCLAERNFVQLSKLDYALVSTPGYSEILRGRVKPVQLQFYEGTVRSDQTTFSQLLTVPRISQSAPEMIAIRTTGGEGQFGVAGNDGRSQTREIRSLGEYSRAAEKFSEIFPRKSRV